MLYRPKSEHIPASELIAAVRYLPSRDGVGGVKGVRTFLTDAPFVVACKENRQIAKIATVMNVTFSMPDRLLGITGLNLNGPIALIIVAVFPIRLWSYRNSVAVFSTITRARSHGRARSATIRNDCEKPRRQRDGPIEFINKLRCGMLR